MPCWATSSSRFQAVLAALAILAGAALSAPAPAAAKVFVTVDEALRLAFPGCDVKRQVAYLSPRQMARVKALAEEEVASAVITSYRAVCGGQPAGTAYFDTHKVRTAPETLFVVVSPAGAVSRLEVIAFDEPEEYLPRAAWYRQFLGRGLDAELQIKRAIQPVTGATLSAHAATSAVRRVLALHRVIAEGEPPK